ncbi:LysE/ArgO family amino acid transporter [Aestuariivirga sp.]|jgi:L-lysine exporter family protein LysE/ArgO|uniref:LysE/ArgO family amino acid transporter n=1 Tax=Aestuariivirga sp. TaxID=2650926 RepID=UPI003784C4DB
MWIALVSGFLTGLSLIVAIGAQNAFVLRQGIRGEHVAIVVAICALSDALLIAAGVGGFGRLLRLVPWLADAMRWAGAAFLFFYGALRFRAAWRGGAALLPAEAGTVPAAQVIATCLIITWANPHVYLDTVVLLGSISAQYAPHTTLFGIGAALGSVAFFSTLGFGARFLAPVFARPRAWVVLESVIGLTMWSIALTLILTV